MEQLTARQTQLGDEIQRLYSNYKKDSASRKTTLEYFDSREKNLDSLWDSFEGTDSQIRELPDVNRGDEYFTSHYYDGIKQIYDKFKIVLQQGRAVVVSDHQEVPQAAPFKPPAPLPPVRNTGERSTNTGVQDQIILQQQPHSLTPAASTTNAQNIIQGLIRRQNTLKTSIKRLIQSNSAEEAPAQTLSAINRLWQNIEQIHLNIWESSENPDSESYDSEEYWMLEENIIRQRAKLSNPVKPDLPQQGQHLTSLQLPKISIPKFDGDCLKWQPFADIFGKMIHEQQNLPSVQKMWYLKANVSGDAEKLIRHLELTEGNYDTAWSTLRDRYENKRSQMSAILERLFSWSNLTTDAKSIRDFHDVINESLSALKNIGISIENWDPILLHILIKKLDRQTHISYEESLENPRELQPLHHLLKVLQHRFQALETVRGKERVKQVLTVTSPKADGCFVCKGNHPIFYCKQFLSMEVPDRLKWVQKRQLCVNCFKADHKAKTCQSRSCTKCSSKHNTLLHLEHQGNPGNVQQKGSEKESAQSTPSTVASAQASRGSVLLATARIKIIANNGRVEEFRALLDSGSQINIVTERLIRRLSIKPKQTALSIEGVGGNSRQTTQRISVKFESTTSGYSSRLEAYVLPNIIPPQPSRSFDTSSWSIPNKISLADPQFYTSAKVDVLLGAEFYFQLLLSGEINLAKDQPIFRNTKLGWVASGLMRENTVQNPTCAVFCEEELSIGSLVEKFWKIEDISPESSLTTAEEACENHFIQTVTRNAEGRFVVRLPLSADVATLGESRSTAYSRFLALERRLQKNNHLRKHYKEFMNQYESLGHMARIDPQHIKGPHCYIPHHCVLRPESSTTKLRVVFDASAKTSTNRSLNDNLLVGPKVQGDLFGMLLRFRLPRFVFTTDIEKMYRQILVNKQDRNLQLILWREDPGQPLRHYQLNTVTYGTSSAPYLAVKCLQQLAISGKDRYPLGASVLAQDFYVDDGMSGSDSLTTAIEMQSQLTNLLQEAGFKLRKWCANHRRLLQNISEEDQEVNLDLENASIKALGLTWIPATDQFCLKANIPHNLAITKRTVISEVARIYDPLGLAGPVVVAAKIFIQQLWEIPLSWDDDIPEALAKKWTEFRRALDSLNNIKIPRHIFSGEMAQQTQVHVFVDASEKAYGAAIYIRASLRDGRKIVRLLCAKSKVAPLQKLSIPRLELCAALLGVELGKKVKKELHYGDKPVFYWSDSEVVLYWLHSTPSSLHTFVANRVRKIQDSTINSQWRHVKSQDNPADAISRGVSPDKLSGLTQWLYGPRFLHGDESIWPGPFKRSTQNATNLEFKLKVPVISATVSSNIENLIYNINNRNSFIFLQRTVAYVLRFTKRAKREINGMDSCITAIELDNALHLIVRTMQQSEFSEELKTLRQSQTVKGSSTLKNVCPFIDKAGVIRVSGRLEAAELPYDAKHPMVLPYNDPITKLILVKLHKENHHCGSQQLLATARQRFWIMRGKTMARNVVHQCIRCTRAKPQIFNQIMGNLPECRVNPGRPFITTGVDYCGPFWVHYQLRGKRPHKVYIAVFCCFTTKAIHLEVVTNLTTDAFIGALKRFISRRGRCQTMYSDNATNFVGAKNQLEELSTAIFSSSSQEKIGRACANEGIDFKFIPPRAPHFGGLWEAAVKSAKHLLLRTTSTASLTHEELETVVIEVEAILNSRPLTPVSSDAHDLTALTPGHFLIGEPLTAQIDTRANQPTSSLATRWKLVSQLKHVFWNRWSKEYLSELQQRHKWRTASSNVQAGQLVIIKEDNVPVMKWPLGRIVKTYKGPDGFVRVVDVKTSSGIIKRPIHRLAPLINEKPNEETANQNLKRLPEQDSSPPKRPKTVNYSLLCTTLLTLILLPAVLGNTISSEVFSKDPGLYFEGIGTAKTITAEWKIMVYYNLVPFRSEIQAFSTALGAFSNLCKISPHANMCNDFVTNLKQLQADMIQDENVIMSGRSRRGAFNIIGNVAKSLFGVLDSDYATEMEHTIRQAENGREHLYSLLRNQTSIIDSTINIIKDTELSLQSRLNETQDEIVRLENQIKEDQNQLRTTHLTTLLSSELILTATRLRQIEAEIINVLTDSHHGRISPSLLSPTQLQRELNIIKAHLPVSRVLPIEEGELIELYKLMRVKAGVTENKVIFEVKLPLIDQQPFELLKIFGIPTNNNGILVAIVPETPYLAINSLRDEYIPLSKDDIQNSFRLNNVFIFENKQATFGKGSMAASCEIDLFNHKASSHCRLTTFTEHIAWIQLHHKNKWIYATINSTEVFAVCGTNVLQFTLHGSGILQVNPTCTLKTAEITIRGHYDVSSNIQTSYSRFKNISTIANISDPITIFNSTQKILQTHTDQLNKLQTQLHKANMSQLHTVLQTNNQHHQAISYVTLGLVIALIILYLMWKNRSSCKRKGNTEAVPTPIPRQNTPSKYVIESQIS